jgi:hypothetical protein
VEDQLHEVRDRLSELSAAVDELMARQRAAPPPEEPPADEPLTPPS